MSAIAKLYAEKVKNGEKTLEEVPEKWRAEVAKMLQEVENADITEK